MRSQSYRSRAKMLSLYGANSICQRTALSLIWPSRRLLLIVKNKARRTNHQKHQKMMKVAMMTTKKVTRMITRKKKVKSLQAHPKTLSVAHKRRKLCKPQLRVRKLQSILSLTWVLVVKNQKFKKIKTETKLWRWGRHSLQSPCPSQLKTWLHSLSQFKCKHLSQFKCRHLSHRRFRVLSLSHSHNSLFKMCNHSLHRIQVQVRIFLPRLELNEKHCKTCTEKPCKRWEMSNKRKGSNNLFLCLQLSSQLKTQSCQK